MQYVRICAFCEKLLDNQLYLALIGKDWRKSFTPISNRRKLDNGAFAGWMLFRVLWSLHSYADESWLLAPFAGLVTPAMLKAIRSLVARQGPYAHRPEEIAAGTYPFDAFTIEVMKYPYDVSTTRSPRVVG